MDTIEYYNKYASRIFEDTVDRDMEPQREEFLEELREIDGDTILESRMRLRPRQSGFLRAGL